jgi:hypothetical protein
MFCPRTSGDIKTRHIFRTGRLYPVNEKGTVLEVLNKTTRCCLWWGTLTAFLRYMWHRKRSSNKYYSSRYLALHKYRELFSEATRWQVARANYPAVIKTALMKRQVKKQHKTWRQLPLYWRPEGDSIAQWICAVTSCRVLIATAPDGNRPAVPYKTTSSDKFGIYLRGMFQGTSSTVMTY